MRLARNREAHGRRIVAGAAPAGKERGTRNERREPPAMKTYEFQVLTVERVHLRNHDASELKRLNDEGKKGWRVIQLRDDPRDGGKLVVFMERELSG
jgi:hypothetical protein